MKTIRLELTGTVPVILHNNQTVDSLNAYTKAIKIVTKKRIKTDEDHEDIARMEWEAGLYIHDGILVIPAQNIYGTLIAAAKMSKDGQAVKRGVRMGELYCPLKYCGIAMKDVSTPVKQEDIPSSCFNKYYKPEFIDRRPVKVQGSTIMRTRPIFKDWSLECSVLFDEVIFDKETLLNHFVNAGKYVGICDYRPSYGLFDVAEIK